MSLRKALFWLHLVAGLSAGLVIAIMTFTGLCISFKPQILAYADRAAAHVAPPSPAARMPLADVLDQVREDWPDARISSLTIHADPARAIDINLGQDGLVYANPYTGESADAASPRLRAFFDFVLRWHRWLGATDIGARRVTANITHAACVVFLGLVLTGLWLWWPRRGSRAVLLFKPSLKGKARDWNWHNAVGLWCSPLLLVITGTGLIMAFHPFGDARSDQAPVITRPEGAKPLPPDALVFIAQTAVTDWETIILRLGGGRGRPQGQNGSPNGGGKVDAFRDGRKFPAQPSGPQPVVVSVEERGSFSPVARQLSINPFTGQILADRTLASLPLGRALQMLAKPVHTGEAGGWLGAFLGSAATLGALVLIYTGFALSWRRFFKRARPARPGAAAS